MSDSTATTSSSSNNGSGRGSKTSLDANSKDPQGDGATQSPSYRLLNVTSEPRTYAELMTELDQSTEDFLTRNHLLHEKAWYEQTARKLDDSRRRWEEEVRVMREQFFSSQAHPKQRERAAALMDAYTFDQLQTRTLRGRDGRLAFQVRFEVRGFESKDVEVRVQGLRLTVRASCDCGGGSGGGSSGGGSGGFRELMRSVNLPSNCLAEQLTACVTSDGVLVAVAPLRSPDSVGGQGGHRCCGANSFASPTETPQLVAGVGGSARSVRLQVQLGPFYRPSEVSVLVGSHRVKISARHEEVLEGRSCFREFQRDYDLPEAVRQSATVATLTPGGCLTVEAPLEETSAAAAAEAAAVTTEYSTGWTAEVSDGQSRVSVVSAAAAQDDQASAASRELLG